MTPGLLHMQIGTPFGATYCEQQSRFFTVYLWPKPGACHWQTRNMVFVCVIFTKMNVATTASQTSNVACYRQSCFTGSRLRTRGRIFLRMDHVNSSAEYLKCRHSLVSASFCPLPHHFFSKGGPPCRRRGLL